MPSLKKTKTYKNNFSSSFLKIRTTAKKYLVIIHIINIIITSVMTFDSIRNNYRIKSIKNTLDIILKIGNTAKLIQ